VLLPETCPNRHLNPSLADRGAIRNNPSSFKLPTENSALLSRLPLHQLPSASLAFAIIGIYVTISGDDHGWLTRKQTTFATQQTNRNVAGLVTVDQPLAVFLPLLLGVDVLPSIETTCLEEGGVAVWPPETLVGHMTEICCRDR
jgi:hypothetical protein